MKSSNIPRFNWQSPKMFRYAGLYMTMWGKRYRIFKVGVE